MGFCHVKNNCMVIRMPSEIDHKEAMRVRKECEMAFMKEIVRDIIFDFSNTTFMDSSGIGLILGRVRQVEPVQGKVYLFGGRQTLIKMWEMSGILQITNILQTVEEMKEIYKS